MVDLLKSETAGDPRADVLVTGLNGTATVTVRSWAPDASGLETRARATCAGVSHAGCASRACCEPPARQRSTRPRASVRADTIGASAGTAGAHDDAASSAPFSSCSSGSSPCSPRSASAARARSRPTAHLQDLRPATIGSNTFVYAADGTLLGSIPAEKNRQPVSLSEISPWMGKATVAIEDRRFYQHGGIDFEGIARAAVQRRPVPAARSRAAPRSRSSSSATSTSATSERTLHRKLVEACLAIKLSDKHGKNWILANYMNTVYYGNHAYGVEAAAQTYFSRRASKLSLLQSALLAGLPQAPSIYDPFKDPERAIERRNDVLKALYDNGEISYGELPGRRSRSPTST